MNKVKSEDPVKYASAPKTKLSANDIIIQRALGILKRRMEREHSTMLTAPQDVRDYCMLQLRQKEHEVFGVLFLDNKHRLITYEELFRGSLTTASVYSREVVKEALKVNCAAVILVHNHPSGCPEPSQADIGITRRLKDALELVDVRVLDHLIVGDEVVSFAERGLV